MNRRGENYEFLDPSGDDFTVDARDSQGVFGIFCGLLFIASFFVSAPWAGFHGLLLSSVGVLVALRPAAFPLPRPWWILAILFVILSLGVFLPAEWFSSPDWREKLEALGVHTGSMVAIQPQQAAETWALFALILLVGLWLAGHRSSSSQLRIWALIFTIGVACYALGSRFLQSSLQTHLAATDGHYGFFPNRNHTATYLAMGTICGLGCVIQSLRDKRFSVMLIALAATGICLWAIAAWSVSRAGVVLIALACIIWLPLLGRRYLGKHGLWAIGLLALTGLGLFFIFDSRVKERLSHTAEKITTSIESKSNPADIIIEKSSFDSTERLDFRIPVFLDTLDMIASHPWTGIGAGQFYYVFPQYRTRTIIAQDADVYHPESDWLWIAAELGVPAALALLTLVVLAVLVAGRGVLAGRDRALRSACLVAALLVPLHGCFDVPGHRISLAWTAALLFSLSLHPPTHPTPARPWPSRFTSAFLLLAAAFLIRAQWLGRHPPATTSAQSAIQLAMDLYHKDIELQKSAEAKGLPYQPPHDEDKLEQAIQILDNAKKLAPLNRAIPRHEAFLAFHFDDKFDRIDQAFAIDRALDPKWVLSPLRQGETWAHADPSRSVPLFDEALRRSKSVEQLDAQNRWNPARVREYVRQLANRYPDLKRVIGANDQSEWKEFKK